MAQWWKPYEPLLEQKTISSHEAILGLIADELCEICATFPPPSASIQWLSPQFEKRFSHQVADFPPVDTEMAKVLGDILLFELDFKPEATAALFRNQRHINACPTRLHQEALHMLWPIILEVLYARKDECSGLLKRNDLKTIVARFLEKYPRKRSRF